MMLTILLMSMLVFFSRYVFLEPRVPLKLNPHIQRMLAYASPAVLTAIWAPIVFLPEEELMLSFENPWLLGASLAAILSWKTKNVLLTTIISMIVFLIMKHGVAFW